MSALRAVTELDARRHQAITSWLKRFRTPDSQRTMTSALGAVARYAQGLPAKTTVDIYGFPWEVTADPEFLDGIQRCIESHVAASTAEKYMSATRSLLRHLAVFGLVPHELAAQSIDCTRHRSKRRGDPPALSIDQHGLQQLLRHCRQDSQPVTGARDLALIALTASTGARRHEVVALDATDIDRRTMTVTFPTTKGGGARRAVLHENAARHLDDWLSLRGTGRGPLFPALVKGGHMLDRHLSAHQFWKLLRHRAELLGFDPPPAPHDLRRWFVTSLLDAGVDVFTTMRAVGHRSPATTARYDRRSLEHLRGFIDRLPIPTADELDAPVDANGPCRH